MSHRVLLIDALNLVRRIFEAGGGAAEANFVTSCSLSLQRAVDEIQPKHAVVVWDSQQTTWRHQLDARYKANREPTPVALVSLIPALVDAFQAAGVASLEVDHYEADDLIATLAKGVADGGGEAVILSTDKMFYQLLRPGIRIYHQFDRRYVEVAEVEEKFGLGVHQLVDYWSLSGDNSNNIKGVPGIGKKTATTLLQAHGNLEATFAESSDKRLEQAMDEALLCRELVLLKQDVALGVNLKTFRLKPTA